MSEAQNPGNDPVLIKKYENRRLYSSTAGKHLTLDEVADLVRKGRSIVVTDATSGEDITSEILTQILLEQGRARGLPVEFLLQLIRLQEDLVEGFVARVVGGGFEMFLQAQRAATEAASREMAKLYGGITKSASAFPFQLWSGLGWSQGSEGSSERERELEAKVRELRQKLQEIEKESKSSSDFAPAKRKAKKATGRKSSRKE